MGSYTVSVIEDNEATKEAHFEKDGKVFLKAVHDKKIDVVKFHGGVRRFSKRLDQAF